MSGDDDTTLILMGRYAVIDLIGAGSFGEVYEVEHRELGKHFALKVMNDRSRESRDVQVKRFVVRPRHCPESPAPTWSR